ncbi:hypothetical protein [Mycobacterium sp. HM-7]
MFDEIVAEEITRAGNTESENVPNPSDIESSSDIDEQVTDLGDQIEENDGPASDEPVDADAPSNSAESPRRTGHRRLIRVLAGALAGLILIGAVGLAGFFGWRLKQQDDVAAAGRAALDVARAYAVTLTSVDNATLDSNFTQVLNGATGEFKDMYSQSAAQLRQLLIDNKAVSHGTVVDAAVKSATPTRVAILIFVDQSISNSANPQPRIDRSRVAITMEKIDNHWLASKVDIK